MKASLKFREEQKPLIKAKIPLNILGLPFQSSLSAGDTKSLSLGLSTFFESGPSFRLSYRPNDAFNPFSLLIKTGIGHFGSPIDAPFTMTAEFNTTSFYSSPRFFIHFKPRFGDFSLKKSAQSSSFNLQNDAVFEDNSLEVIEKVDSIGDFGKSKFTSLPLKSSLESAVSGVEVGAKTELPIRSGAVLKLRWGIKLPEEGFQSFMNRTVKVSPHGIPLLVLNKIGIEHVGVKEDKKVVGPGPEGRGKGSGAEVAERCFSVKRELETLRFENAQLGKALEDLKAEFGKSKGGKRGKGEERKTMEVVADVDGEGDVSKRATHN